MMAQKVESTEAQGAHGDEVVDEKDLREIVPKVARKWRELAGKLGLSDEDTFPIEADNYGPTGGVEETTFQMLLTWKRKRGDNAKKSVLIAALNESGLTSAADAMQNSYR